MKPIFLDTVGLIALWETKDQWHSLAVEAFAQLLAEGAPVVTTPQVLLECANAVSRRPTRQDVIDLRKELTSIDALISPTADEEMEAWLNYEKNFAGQAGVIDHLSFLVMKRLGITDAFTNDKHFEYAGFVTLF